MRVLHVYKSYYPDSIGGIEKTIYQLSEELEGKGIHSLVLSLSKKPNANIYAVSRHRAYQARQDIFLFSTGLSIEFFFAFRRFIRKADIVHYHYPWPWMDLACLIWGRKKKSICTYHSDIVRQRVLNYFYQPIMRAFLGRMDRIVATSDNYLASSEVLGRYKQKVEVIPIGIEPYPFDALPEFVVSSWREKLPTKFFFFIGVLRYYKGLHILIDALAVWDVPTVIVGAGPIECSLKKRAREYGLKNLIFLGAISEQDKMAVLSLSYAMLFPSHLRSEAFGISLLEGAMAEKPLVSSEIGTGTSFINIHGETGLVVEAGNPVSLRAAMMRIWNDEEFARDMGRRGRRRFEALFTARRMGAAYTSLYQELHAKDASLEFLPKVGHANARFTR